jgi:DNA-binding transcriptional ArsR family regulator
MAYDQGLTALADPTRRLIFERIVRAPGPVGEVAASFSVSRPAVSQHLRVLADAGLVTVRSVGARRVYSADPRGLNELRSYVDRMWSRALDEFEQAAKRSARTAAARQATKAEERT